MQLNFKAFINSLPRGQAEFYSQRSIIARPKWSDVEDYLKGIIDFAELKAKLGC